MAGKKILDHSEGALVMEAVMVSPLSLQLCDFFSPTAPSILERGTEKRNN